MVFPLSDYIVSDNLGIRAWRGHFHASPSLIPPGAVSKVASLAIRAYLVWAAIKGNSNGAY